MNLASVFIIVLLILYSAYKDYMFQREREKLELKLMSKNLDEYTSNVVPVKDENEKAEKDPYLPIEDATAEQILGSKDVL